MDLVVRYVCAGCNDPTKHIWLQFRRWRGPMSCQSCDRAVIHDTVRKVPKHVVCGPACRLAVYAALARKKRRLSKRACPTCGKLFPPKRTDALFCSSPCRQRAYRQRAITAPSPPP